MGLGPGAHGFWPNGVRTQYPSSWKEWKGCTKPQREVCTPEQEALDWLITAIRHKDGIYLPTLQDMGYTLNVSTEIRKLEAFNNWGEQRPKIA